MNFNWWTFAMQAVNFLILVWLLRRFLFKPVGAIVARRKDELAHGMQEALVEKQKALNLQRDLQAKLAGIDTERQKASAEQLKQLVDERKKMIDEAHSEAEKILNQATVLLGEERAAATQELFSATIQLAVSLAERLLRELPLPSIEQAFLTRILEYLDGLSSQDRAALISRLGTNSLSVTTAYPLEVTEQAQWREQLEKRVGVAGIKFNSNPALIAGAEVTFPNATLRFNWRDALTTAAEEINRNEHVN